MTRTLPFLFLLMFAGSCLAQDQQPYVVAELFTSESCLACPDADRLLSELSDALQKEGKAFYALEYHVDYWGKGDWKDPFGKNQFTFRQENYSRVLPGKEMYTPMLILNGHTETELTSATAVRAAAEKALAGSAGRRIALHVDSLARDSLYISYTTPGAAANHLLRLTLSENGIRSAVTDGVNKGKTLRHEHLVRVLFTVDRPGVKGQAAIPLRGLRPGKTVELTGFLQEKKTMRIVGAARIPLQ